MLVLHLQSVVTGQTHSQCLTKPVKIYVYHLTFADLDSAQLLVLQFSLFVLDSIFLYIVINMETLKQCSLKIIRNIYLGYFLRLVRSCSEFVYIGPEAYCVLILS